MKKLPDNIADFKTLIDGGYIYVDKTKHIYNLLTGSGQNFFLSRPRRFGKTLLISVLEQIFLGNRDLFKGLWIDQSDYTWPKHPVLRLSMAGVGSRTPEQFEKNLILELHQKAEAAEISLGKASTAESCFKTLVKELSKKGQVVVLIDEYEHPILSHLHQPELAAEIRESLKTFYGILKDLDKNLRFVFLTGVTKFSKTSIFSGINNLTDLTLSERASTLLGIEPQELELYFSEQIDLMAQKQEVSREQILASLKDWYNGYCFSEELPSTVYNPCSVLKCLESKKFKNYWFETGTPSFLLQLFKEKDYPILDLETVALSTPDLGTFDIDQIELSTLLFQTGYLTIKSYDPESDIYTLSYPNKEVSESMMRIIAPMMTGERSFAPWQLLAVKLKKALAASELDTFCSLLKLFFADIPYTLHVGLERYYQTIFYMLMKFMGAEIVIEEATNIGRIDAVLQTPSHVYVIEFKLDKSAQKALEQIKNQKYGEKYKLLKKPIVAIGLVFDSKTRNIVEYAWEKA